MRIADYAIVGDCRSVALISRDGSCDWLCWPIVDSPPIFAALLDDERGGRFRIAPRGKYTATRAYLPETNVLVTRFETSEGVLTLTDLMPIQAGKFDDEPMPENELLRVARCERGSVELEVLYDPRFEFGREKPLLRQFGKLGLRAQQKRGGLLTLHSAVSIDPNTGRGTALLEAGELACFSLTFHERDVATVPPIGDYSLRMIERTASVWRTWARRTKYDGPWRDAVVRSALVLKLLAYAPSGAIVAAPTTSLPERPGGALNWDYRYCWLRDAALTARALYGLGHLCEAQNFIDWLLMATSLTRPKLHVLYDVYGRLAPKERDVPHLRGFGGARPVRVGNGARLQVQLDIYGEVITAAADFLRKGGEIDRPTRQMLRDLGRQVMEGYREPDEGIWEERGTGHSFTHSRAVCWAALDRVLSLHQDGLIERLDPEPMRAARAAIRDDIEMLAWSEQLATYTRTLAGGDVDMSLLLLPWYGYCDADSPRMRATWRRIVQRLHRGGGLFQRYHGPLTTGEGAFLICSFWAAEYLALGGGSLHDASTQFEQTLARANDVGLFAEEVMEDGELLGNYPQAYTHIGLINAALTMADRLRRGEPREKRDAEEVRA